MDIFLRTEKKFIKCRKLCEILVQSHFSVMGWCFTHLWHFMFQVSYSLDSLSANFTKRSNTLKQFVGKLPMNCLSKSFHTSVNLCSSKKSLFPYCVIAGPIFLSFHNRLSWRNNRSLEELLSWSVLDPDSIWY